MSSFRSKTIRGFKWSFLNKILFQFINFILTIVLARLLSPEDFGLFAMITVFSNFGMLFKDFGFGHALIYNKDVSNIEFNSVFVLNLAIGIILTSVFYFSAPFIASFYEESRLENLTKVFSIIFFIQAFGLVNITELKKKVDFKSLAIIENSAHLLASIIAIMMAYYGFGVWSLIANTVLYITLRTIIILFVSDYRPKFAYDINVIKDLWRYSYNVSGNSFLTYWMRNLDNLMIGKMIGQQPLGIYNMAYKIMLLPMKNISSVVKDVLFPSFSSIGNDIDKIRTVYLKVVQTVALFTFPLLAGLACLSDLFVNIVLGDKWLEMIPILSLLSLVAIPQSIFTINGTLYLNTGRPDIPFKINMVSLPIYVFGFYFGLKYYGILGLVYAYISIYALLVIPIYYFCAKQINLQVIEFIRKLVPVATSVILMSIIVLFFKEFLIEIKLKEINIFILSILSGIVSYLIAVLFFKKRIDLYQLFYPLIDK